MKNMKGIFFEGAFLLFSVDSYHCWYSGKYLY